MVQSVRPTGCPMPRRSHAFGLLLAALSLGLTGCSMNLATHEELVEKTFAAKPKPTVIVETFNGAIDVKVDGQALLLAKVRKRGSGATEDAAKADCANIEVTFEEEAGNTFRITAKRIGNSSWSGNSGAAVEILVPENAALELKTANGAVNANGAFRSLTTKSSNGAISAKGGSGIIDVQTSNGSVEVEATTADLLKMQSSNGRLRFVGSLGEGEHSMKTSNGSVNVQLPSETSFRLDASTSNGRVGCEFDLRKKEKERKSQLIGTVGTKPLATLTIKTSNGTVEIEKRD